MTREKPPEEKARSKRVHAAVMIVLGAIMAACALAGGIIIMTGRGDMPTWMYGRWARRSAPKLPFRVPVAPLARFADFGPESLARAKDEGKLVLLHMAEPACAAATWMEENAYAVPEVASWTGSRVVLARADAYERPELTPLYGSGGCLTTALLTPDGGLLGSTGPLSARLLLAWGKTLDAQWRADPAHTSSAARLAGRAVPVPSASELAEREDAAWGGVFRGGASDRKLDWDYSKSLPDQAAALRAFCGSDPARARRTLAFMSKFLALPAGGWAAAVAGEVRVADGRVAAGWYYFGLDDAGRRALGLPGVINDFRPAIVADAAQAVLDCAEASSAEKTRARKALALAKSRF